MEPKKLSFEKRVEVYTMALGICGVQFDRPEVIELLILVNDRVVESGGMVGVNELIELRDEHLKKHPNEPSGPKADSSKE
jgi:hypothetical protein